MECDSRPIEERLYGYQYDVTVGIEGYGYNEPTAERSAASQPRYISGGAAAGDPPFAAPPNGRRGAALTERLRRNTTKRRQPTHGRPRLQQR